MSHRAELRKVLHRKPVPFMPYAHVPRYLLVHVVETLECGHTLTTYPQSDPLIAVRRRCVNCDDNQVSGVPKKPSGSVRLRLVAERKAA